ncbi:microtubule-associated protein futsch [Diorhabda sublineata]|uniref:microtubule-associated protein futsch n=1 Tax=Diorhabda sublineata TaxID=1163346 RepID=UPI0024E0849E|nr:microtubule-associated protein futsch [Diorhabda sublineata]
MESANGVSGDGGDKGGPPPPPSPLTGCYLLIVIGEPYNEQHKDIILQKIAKGLLSWDLNECLVDLEKELAVITEQSLEGEEARYGERLIQFASENLVTEILIHPAVSTLAQCMRNLLSSFTRHRHIIHAGYTFAANGSWALQDGTFSYVDFCEAFQELEVQRVVRAYENGISMDIHCSPEGDWPRLPKEPFSKACKVRINPTDVLTSGSPALSGFIKYLSPFLIPIALENLLESSDVVGNIRFSRPTLYVFPGGQGDAALFGINGFNMLLDGGYSRKACFWDFVRHLDRLDAVLMTRLNNSNVGGISSVLRRKKQDALYPQIGHFFCNIQERKSILSPDGDKDKDPLLINLLDEGQEIISNLRHLHLNPQVCYRDSEPINLYHKVGHGTLDMYVLSPAKDSKEVREFLLKWNHSDQKLFANAKSSRDFSFPVQNLISISALLVWRPANPNDTITRILYPGSCPQNRILEGLDRLKNLEFIKYPTCSEKSLAPISTSKKTAKEAMFDKIIPKEKPAIEKKENKFIENDAPAVNGDTKDKTVKKSDSTESDKSIRAKKLEEQKIIENGEKPKPKPKTQKSRSDSQQRKKPSDKKSPTLPKKPIENGEAKKSMKQSPITTPAKSAKDANNRKVVESKVKKEVAKVPPTSESKPKAEKVERKPISRRPPAKKAPISPVKKIVNGVQKPDSISRKGKLDKEATTDSSTVSTPSADQESVLKKDISKLTPEELQQIKAQELAELKEEQEAVKEIEAVFRKGEVRKDEEEALRKVKDISIDDKLDTEEYLIIEKEEIEQLSLEEKDAKEENQKLARDSEESEKLRKSSKEEQELEKQEIQKQLKGTASEPDEASKIKEEIQSSKVTSPEEKVDISTDRKTTDKEEEEIKDVVESQPDEKVSANIKSGDTTTAPTLPEDERIPLDEIKEDNGAIEEKYIKEETKEKEIPTIQIAVKPFEGVSKLPNVVGIRLDKQQHIRDIVKTPDEVADLPVHEEVDYEFTHELKVETPKSNEIVEKKIDHEPEPETGLSKEQVKEEEPEKDKDEDEAKKMMQEELKTLTETVLKSESVLEKDILKDSEKKISGKVDASREEHEIELEKDKVDEGIDVDAEIEETVEAIQATQEISGRQKRSIDYEEEAAPKDKDMKVNDIITEKMDIAPAKDSKELTKEEIETQEIEKVDKPEIVPTTEQEFLKEVRENTDQMKKIDDKLQSLKDALVEPKSTTEKIDDEEISQTDRDRIEILKGTTIDKLELGRKSPKEREEDVMKIVAGVAEVLKSDAPLEEFEGKIPITTYTPYTQELRETHITTVDSPTIEMKVINTDIPTIPEEPHIAVSSFLEEERKATSIHESTVETKLANEDKRNSLIRESQELMMATSKMLSNIKSGKPEEIDDEKSKEEVESQLEDTDEEKPDEDVGTVHRMLVTASSEDGGEETEICPPGTIIFSRSSESSGRSSPDPSQKVSKSSIVDTVSDTLSTVRQVADLPSEKDSGIDDADQETQEKISDNETGKKEKTEELLISGTFSPDKDVSITSLVKLTDTKSNEEQGFLDKIGEKIEYTLTSDNDIKLDTEIIARKESIAKENTDEYKLSHTEADKVIEETSDSISTVSDVTDDNKDVVTTKINKGETSKKPEKVEDTITIEQDEVFKDVQDKQKANIHDSLKDSSDFIEKRDDVVIIKKVSLHEDEKQIKSNIQEDIETSIKKMEEGIPPEIRSTEKEIEATTQEKSEGKENIITQFKDEVEDVFEQSIQDLEIKKDYKEITKHEIKETKHETIEVEDVSKKTMQDLETKKDYKEDTKHEIVDIKFDLPLDRQKDVIVESDDMKDEIDDLASKKNNDENLDTFDKSNSTEKREDLGSSVKDAEEKEVTQILDKSKRIQEDFSSKVDTVPDKKLAMETVEDMALKKPAHDLEEDIENKLASRQKKWTEQIDAVLDKEQDIKSGEEEVEAKELDVKEGEKRETSTTSLKDKKVGGIDDTQVKPDRPTASVEDTNQDIQKVSDVPKSLEKDIHYQENELQSDVPVDKTVAIKYIDKTADTLKTVVSETMVTEKEKKDDITGAAQNEKDKLTKPDSEIDRVHEDPSEIIVRELEKTKKNIDENIKDEISDEKYPIIDIIGMKYEDTINETKALIKESSKDNVIESIKDELSEQDLTFKDQITEGDISTNLIDKICESHYQEDQEVTNIVREKIHKSTEKPEEDIADDFTINATITDLHDTKENIVDSIKDKKVAIPDKEKQLLQNKKDDFISTHSEKEKDVIESVKDKKEDSEEQLTHRVSEADVKHDSKGVTNSIQDKKEDIPTSFEESKLYTEGLQDMTVDVIDSVDDKISLSTEQLKDGVKDVKHVSTDSVSYTITDIKDLEEVFTEKTKDKKEDNYKDFKESTQLTIEGVKDDVSVSIGDKVTGLKDMKEDLIDSIGDKKDATAKYFVDSKKQLIDNVEDIKHEISTSISNTNADIQEAKEFITDVVKDKKQEIEIKEYSEKQLTQEIKDTKHDLTSNGSDASRDKKDDTTSKAKENRGELAAAIEKSKEPLAEYMKDIEDKLSVTVTDTFNILQDKKEDITSTVEDKGEELAEAIKESKEPLAKDVEDIKDNLSDIVSDTIHDLQDKKEDIASKIEEKKEELLEIVKEPLIQDVKDIKENVSVPMSDTVIGFQDTTDFYVHGIKDKKEDITSRETMDPLTTTITDTITDLQQEKIPVIDDTDDKKQEIEVTSQKSNETLIEDIIYDSSLSKTKEKSSLAIQDPNDHSKECVIDIKDEKADIVGSFSEVRDNKDETEGSIKYVMETIAQVAVEMSRKSVTEELVGDSEDHVTIKKDDILHKKVDTMNSLEGNDEEITTDVEQIVKPIKEHVLGSGEGVKTEQIQNNDDIKTTSADIINDFTLKSDEMKSHLDNEKYKQETDIKDAIQKIGEDGLNNMGKGKDVFEKNKTTLKEDVTEIESQYINEVVEKKDEDLERDIVQIVELEDHLHKVKDELINAVASVKTDKIEADADKLLDVICKKPDSLKEDIEDSHIKEQSIENNIDQKVLTKIDGAVDSTKHLDTTDRKTSSSTELDEQLEFQSEGTVTDDVKEMIQDMILTSQDIPKEKMEFETIPDEEDAIHTKFHETTDFVEIKKDKDTGEVNIAEIEKHVDNSLTDYKTIAEKEEDKFLVHTEKTKDLKEPITGTIDSSSERKDIIKCPTEADPEKQEVGTKIIDSSLEQKDTIESTIDEITEKQEMEFSVQTATRELVDDNNEKKDILKKPIENVAETLKRTEESSMKGITDTTPDTRKIADDVITNIKKDNVDYSTDKYDKIEETKERPIEGVLSGKETALEHQLIGGIASIDIKDRDDEEKKGESYKMIIDRVSESIEIGVKDICSGISESNQVVENILKEKSEEITKDKDELVEFLEGTQEKIEGLIHNKVQEKVDDTTKTKDEITENLKELREAIHGTVEKRVEDMTEIEDSLKKDLSSQKEKIEGAIQQSFLKSVEGAKEDLLDKQQVLEYTLSGVNDKVTDTISKVISKSEQKVHDTIQNTENDSKTFSKTLDEGISDSLDFSGTGKSTIIDEKLTDKDEKSPSEIETMDEKLMKKEQILEEAVDDIEETFKTVVSMTESVIFDKCSKPDGNDSPNDEKEVQQQEKILEHFSEDLEGTFKTVDRMSHELSFEKCDSKIKKDDTGMEKSDREKQITKEEETAAVQSTDNLGQTFETVEEITHDVTFSKYDTEIGIKDISSKKDDIDKSSLETESKVTEKGDKETMEKEKSEPLTEEYSLPKDHSSIPMPIPEKKSAELSDKKQDCLKIATISLKEEQSDELKKREEIQNNLLHEKQFPGGVTPPTAPASPNVNDDIRLVKPSDFDADAISRQILDKESDDEEDQYSITSQIAHSRDSSQADFEIIRSHDPMNMSFYGALPDDEAIDDLHETSKDKPHESFVDKTDSKSKGNKCLDTQVPSSADLDKKSSIESWGKPLELPAPTYLYEITKAKYSTITYQKEIRSDQDSLPSTSIPSETMDMMTASFYGNLPGDDETDPIQSWGKPLGLPSPAAPNDNKGTPKKERKLPANVSAKNKLNDDKKRAESPSKYNKNKKVNPVYVDLTYVPHHGNAYYAYVDFFRRVRARYYVFSGIEPSREVYNALLEAKQTWEDKELEVTIIPTYDTDILGYWVTENEELLTKYKIDLSPSASRCTINLQDHETSCSAYRLEF